MPLETPISDLVRQLRRVGLRPTERLVASILEHGPAARGELLDLATRTADLTAEEPVRWGPVHALRLLGELPDLSIIEPLLDALPLDIDPYAEEEELEAQRIWADEVLQMIGRCGAPALPPLWARADDTQRPHHERGAALQALSYVVAVDPDPKEAVIDELRTRLGRETAPDMGAYLVGALAELGARAAYAEVMAAYRERRVDTEMMPAAMARQLLLGSGHPDLACARHPLWERYDQHGPFASST